MSKYEKQREQQQKILALLRKEGSMSTRSIVTDLFPNEQVAFGTPKYNSVTRCLRRMRQLGMIEKTVGQTMWKKVNT